MATPVFLTVDTALIYPHQAGVPDSALLYDRSLEPAAVGISYQLEMFRQRGLKACFFVDPMPALRLGLGPVRRLVETILEAGQEVQLRLDPDWSGAEAGDDGVDPARGEMGAYAEQEQRDLIAGATDLLVAAGAPRPIAFRAGRFAASDATLRALSTLGFAYDSSHNGAGPRRPGAIDLPATQIAPVMREGVIEVPVTLIEDQPEPLRQFQICALSAGEIRAALEHAVVEHHAAMTIVSQVCDLANGAGTRANAIHLGRFETLCTLLEEWAELLPTTHFADRPALRLDRPDAPLGPNSLRTRWRQAEQLWSSMVEERAA